MPNLDYVHVDVFSQSPYGGNSVPVFLKTDALDGAQMQLITQELRHFEAVFLEPTSLLNAYRARIFDLFEELPFAGHPIIGAAAVLHSRSGDADAQSWTFHLADKAVTVTTEATSYGYYGLLDQGRPDFLGEIDAREAIAQAFCLASCDLRTDLPIEVVSTGLRYMIIPVRPGALSRARIASDISDLLRDHGAQFAVLFDEDAVEARHWNNDGVMEDVATGSAAGTIGAYRLKHGLAQAGKVFTLNQGRFAGRPSQLFVQPEGDPTAVTTVRVGGGVVLMGSGTLCRPGIAS